MKITWLGHSAFHLAIDGIDLLIDPFCAGNPNYPAGYEDGLAKVDVILVTHGHGDHIGDATRLARKYQLDGDFATRDLCVHRPLRAREIRTDEHRRHGHGRRLRGVHGAGVPQLDDHGKRRCRRRQRSGRFVVSGAGHTLYHTGDTGVFGDMALIQRLYQPDIGLIPIGDRYTMGPTTAAYACNELLDLKIIVPMHWGTFPALSGTPERSRPW